MIVDPIIDVDHIIDDVMNKYYDEENKCFKSYREDEVDDYELQEELVIALINEGIGSNNIIVDVTEAFDCSGGTVSVLSIVWYDKKYGIHLRTYVLEDI